MNNTFVFLKKKQHDTDRIAHKMRNENTGLSYILTQKDVFIAIQGNLFTELLTWIPTEKHTSHIALIKIYSTTGNTYELDIIT